MSVYDAFNVGFAISWAQRQPTTQVQPSFQAEGLYGLRLQRWQRPSALFGEVPGVPLLWSRLRMPASGHHRKPFVLTCEFSDSQVWQGSSTSSFAEATGPSQPPITLTMTITRHLNHRHTWFLYCRLPQESSLPSQT